MTTPFILPQTPREAVTALLRRLPSRRMRSVIERRFGLTGGEKATLEAIGRDYKITRERVRQIEADALKFLRKDENLVELEPLFRAVGDHLKSRGEVMTEHQLLSSYEKPQYRSYLLFLMELGKSFTSLSDTSDCQKRWTVNKDRAVLVERFLNGVVNDLEAKRLPVPHNELSGYAARSAQEIFGEIPEQHILSAYLAMSKRIGKNPYDEYGLIHWPTVSPSGVKDKAYVALWKAGKPLHFRDVARAINRAKWSRKPAHPQTVHNELIKDSRFVLVGRGLYALQEWGYEPGSVKEVLRSVFKNSGRPLTKDEIVHLLLEKRAVKPQTILLNLQNRSLFKKTSDGKFALV